MLRMIIIMIGLFICGIASGQHAVSKEMRNLQSAGREFRPVEIFHFQTQDLQNRSLPIAGLKKGTIISLDQDAIESLFQSQNEFISINVPITNRTQMKLILKRHEIITPDFKLFTGKDRDHPVDYTHGLHYMGIIDGDPNSLVGLSIYRNQIMAFISDRHGNLEIKLIPGDEDFRHVIFRVEDQDQSSTPMHQHP